MIEFDNLSPFHFSGSDSFKNSFKKKRMVKVYESSHVFYIYTQENFNSTYYAIEMCMLDLMSLILSRFFPKKLKISHFFIRLPNICPKNVIIVVLYLTFMQFFIKPLLSAFRIHACWPPDMYIWQIRRILLIVGLLIFYPFLTDDVMREKCKFRKKRSAKVFKNLHLNALWHA